MYESACTPFPSTSHDTELTSDLVNAELSIWEPTYDYGTDSVFSITPPLVSPDNDRIYEVSCQVAQKGPVSLAQKLYASYLKQWSSSSL